jgi:NAD(P)-dependent dehydrogenase (short-subunit alcohol dehydrogenase family)
LDLGLAGKVGVVTGGASGIGLQILRQLVGEGMSVVALDVNADACAQLRASAAASKEPIRVVTADVGTPEGASAAIDTAVAEFGRLDLVCNNAAKVVRGKIEDFDLATWREMFRVNVDGTMLCSKLALPHLRRQGGGAIVNIASISGLAPYIAGGAYSATKAAIIMLTKVLALEAGPDGIRVNCICPGTIRHRLRGNEHIPPEGIPVGRRGRTDDVAQMVAYLASDAAGFVNGSVLVIDGGETAGRKQLA